MQNKIVFAFIFARGGSKELKDKNLYEIGGKPLIAHSILAAKKNKKIKKVCLYRFKIVKISEAYGAEIIHRPKRLALDKTPEWLAWQHAINYYKK